MTSLPTSMLVPAVAGLWSAMIAGTPSSSSFSASQCIGSPCSRGSVGYKDNVDNAKELFKSALVDEAKRSFRPSEPNAMRNVPLDDDDDVFSMVN
ncbi:unnamed protein product [Sphagnum compactum]